MWNLSPFMISHWYLWQEQHFEHLQTMGPASSMTPTITKPHMTHNSCNTTINSTWSATCICEKSILSVYKQWAQIAPIWPVNSNDWTTHMAHYSRNIMTNFGHHSVIFVKGESFQVFSKEWAQMAPVWPLILNPWTPHMTRW